MSVDPAFSFHHVTLTRPHGTVLDDVSFTISSTGLTAVIGPSGAGKSTLLRLCNRLTVPTAGTIIFRGDDLSTLDPLALRRRVGMVFQRPTPFAGSILDNLRVADPAITRDAAARMIASVHLDTSLLDRPARELSGGEAQRMCLARTLTTRPEVLLMDEPTSSLDDAARDAIEHLTSGLVAKGTPVVFVSHDMNQVERLADSVITVDHGTVVTR